MCKFLKVLGKIAAIFSAIIGVLFVVYFWNLDQKLLLLCTGMPAGL